MSLSFRLVLALVVAFSAAAGASSPALATVYFVSSHGHDTSSGTSRQDAWQTVARVNAAQLQPGDKVRFEGGQRFSDATLMPPASGAPHHRITFGSYGHGRATIAHAGVAVWFSDRHYLRFDRLILTTDDTPGAILSGSPGGGSTYVTVRRCVLRNTAGVGIQSPNRADSHWRIARNRIVHTGDSGLILWGAHESVVRNRIVDTGWNRAIAWDKHGIYVKGPAAVVRGNRISRFQANGVSLRLDDARVVGNRISDGPIGIAYFDYSRKIGRTYVLQNRVADVQVGFYFSTDPDANDGSKPREDFVIAYNVFSSYGVAADLIGAKYSRMRFVHNVLRSGATVALGAAPPAGGRYVEHDNRFARPSLFDWNRMWIPYLSYRRISGQGARDRFASRGR